MSRLPLKYLLGHWTKKLFSFLRYLSFSPNFAAHVGKYLDKKTRVNSKIYDIIIWEASYNIDIAQYLK